MNAPTCTACRAPLVIRQARPLWVVCCAKCKSKGAVVACGTDEQRAVAEWKRREMKG